jgi:ethanolamine ammonia-lyase large subunit
MLETTLDKARTQYANDNAKFMVGDYIRCVTGIIKVVEIKYQFFMGTTHIGYCGYKYWYKDKQLVRTKKKDIVCLTDYGNLVKLEITNI